MNILAIETSTPEGSLALLAGQTVVAEESFRSYRAHNAMIFEPLDRILRKAGGDLDWIAVGTGPGSYSGVRVGIAVANALSLALDAPAAGISSLLAPAAAGEELYHVIGDARRHSFFLATVRRARVAAGPELLDAEALEARVRSLLEGGEKVLTFDENPPLSGLGVQRTSPVASGLAAVLAAMDSGERDASGRQPLQPIYLRAPYITKQ